ncbi:hypothetical protein [Nonomuraea sp. NPDC049400]
MKTRTDAEILADLASQAVGQYVRGCRDAPAIDTACCTDPRCSCSQGSQR